MDLKIVSYHFSTYGRRSNSNPNVVRGCVCKCQYASAIYIHKSVPNTYKRGVWTGERGRKHTAPGSNFPSSCSLAQSFVRGISITPSIITWETWTPFGPNSRASDWASARRANLPVAKAAKFADPFTLAVAPVKIRVGGYCSPVDFWRSGRVLLAKLNAPILSSIN